MRTPNVQGLLIVTIAAVLLIPTGPVWGLPAYDIVSIGSQIPGATGGATTAVNEDGDAAGYAAFDTSWQHLAFVYTAELGPVLLPRPPWAVTARALDLSDRLPDGTLEVVGWAANSIYSGDLAIVWRVSVGDGSVVEMTEPGTLDGLVQSQITAVNNIGDRVGYSAAFMQFGGPATWFAPGGPLPIASLQTAVAVNESRVVLAGVGWESARYDLNTGVQENLGRPDGRFNGAFGKDMNDLGQVVAQVPTGDTDPRGQFTKQVWRYSDGPGWEYLFGGSNSLDTPYAINNPGDVVGKIIVGLTHTDILYLEETGTSYVVEDLLAEGFQGVNVDALNDINDARQIATSGPGGPVLLTPAGALPAPSAPSDLIATPHPATQQQSFVSIDLLWTDTSALTQEFAVERRLADTGAFAEIGRTTRTDYRDLTVDLGVTYDYRVKAVGVAGDSPYSNVATATAPATGPEGDPPTVAILRPSSGETVSGNVTVEVTASDPSGIFIVRVLISSVGSPTVLCEPYGDGAVSFTGECRWNTRKLPEGDYTITARAIDIWGNWSNAEVTVTVAERKRGKPKSSNVPAGVFAVTEVTPLGAGANLRFSLDRPGYTTLTVFDNAGRPAGRPVDGYLPSGSHSADWSGRIPSGGAAPNGVYYYRLTLDGRSVTGKLVLAR